MQKLYAVSYTHLDVYKRQSSNSVAEIMNFQIKQCEIKIEYLFFAVIAFLLFTDTTGVALLGIAATVLHEAGHLIMMLLLGSSVKTVRSVSYTHLTLLYRCSTAGYDCESIL